MAPSGKDKEKKILSQSALVVEEVTASEWRDNIRDVKETLEDQTNRLKALEHSWILLNLELHSDDQKKPGLFLRVKALEDSEEKRRKFMNKLLWALILASVTALFNVIQARFTFHL